MSTIASTADNPAESAADVVWLTDPTARDVTRFGGKAAGLANLALLGVPVPRGFALAADALGDAVIERRVDPTHLHGARTRAARASEYAVALSAELGGATAVRSSALAEDGTQAAAAGQYETVLGVEDADGLRAAMERVLASQFASHVQTYWQRETALNTVAVVVQRLVAPRTSGVLFTRDPVSGALDYVIEAGLGLGTSVVDGDGVFERTHIDPATLEITAQSLRTSGIQRHWDAAQRKVVASAVVDRPQRPLLATAELIALVEFGRFISREMAVQADIEWAIDDDGLWILQARPITTLRGQR